LSADKILLRRSEIICRDVALKENEKYRGGEREKRGKISDYIDFKLESFDVRGEQER
jgi:hypothetical protein